MTVDEINDISESFLEAWKEFFGAPMYLVPFNSTASSTSDLYSDLYSETEELKYDFASKVLFHGTLKDFESLDTESGIGDKINTDLGITFITKELADAGIPKINTKSIIQYTDPNNDTYYYKIVDLFKRVQFMNYKIFTKLKVVELKDYKRGLV